MRKTVSVCWNDVLLLCCCLGLPLTDLWGQKERKIGGQSTKDSECVLEWCASSLLLSGTSRGWSVGPKRDIRSKQAGNR
jgi:hypothetical protein